MEAHSQAVGDQVWSVGYYRHGGMMRRAEDHVEYWHHASSLVSACGVARWLIGALGADPEAAADSIRTLVEFEIPELTAGGGGDGWHVGPYAVELTAWWEPNRAGVLDPMGRLVTIAGELHYRRIQVTASGYAADAGYDLTPEVQTLLSWGVAELSGALPRLSDKGRSWLDIFGFWKVEWYNDFADVPHAYSYHLGQKTAAYEKGSDLVSRMWPNVSVRSPLGKTDILASDVLGIRNH